MSAATTAEEGVIQASRVRRAVSGIEASRFEWQARLIQENAGPGLEPGDRRLMQQRLRCSRRFAELQSQDLPGVQAAKVSRMAC